LGHAWQKDLAAVGPVGQQAQTSLGYVMLAQNDIIL